MGNHTNEELEAVAFVGQTLGPLFSEDPKQGGAQALYASLAELDVDAAAEEWPFCETQVARTALAQLRHGAAADIDAVTQEYRRLFVGPGHKAAPPWGSVYTDHDGVLFGESALQLHDWLSTRGVLVAADDRMPDDHLGRMLSLMAWMAQERPDILDAYLAEHLLTWAFHFLELLQREARHPFFAELAQLTAASLGGMQRAFGLQVHEPRFYR